MKINNIKICGFRGFNDLRELDFSNQLTIIYGPNSYGKTSISEALEWLLLGDTSKVENCLSGVSEYRGSYRNIHFPPDQPSYIEIETTNESKEKLIIRGELDISGDIRKYLNTQEIQNYPWEILDCKNNSPFILQHALQDILQTSPKNRYERISKILGTQYLLILQNEFTSLATKYNKPSEVDEFLNKFNQIIESIGNYKDLESLHKAIIKYDLDEIKNEVRKIINSTLPHFQEEDIFIDGRINNDIIKLFKEHKSELVQSFFDKDLTLSPFTEDEKKSIESFKCLIKGFVNQEIIDQYFEIKKTKEKTNFLNKANFFNLGYEIFSNQVDICPFCGAEISDKAKKYIEEMHSQYEKEAKEFENLEKAEKEFNLKFDDLNKNIDEIIITITSKVLNYKESNNDADKEKISEIFGKGHVQELTKIMQGIENFSKEVDDLNSKKENISSTILNIRNTLSGTIERECKLDELKAINEKLIMNCEKLIDQIDSFITEYADAIEIFTQRLDEFTGTEVLALKIKIFENLKNIEKYIKISQSIDSLKTLRNKVTAYVNKKTKDLIENQLTNDVLDWYNVIKTDGDPDVHFSGFKLGGTVARQQIEINAQSYGEPLLSAVSSLSESKLNALGLSIKISNNINSDSPFDFLIIDDPVQSLDDDHATQFTTIVRTLIEKHGKQVVILSHSKDWINQIKKGTESLDGIYYEITGYNKSGPFISEFEWRDWKRRLSDIEAICANPEESTIHLQYAEEEIRIVICQIASIILRKKTGKSKKARKMNEADVRKALVTSGIELGKVDKICQAFETVDDAHHSPERYSAKKKRIEAYCTWLHELEKEHLI